MAQSATCLQKPWRRAHTLLHLSVALHQRHHVNTPAGPVHFISTHRHALDYPSSLLTREPETIVWLDSIQPGQVYWDIGANVGGYALYAARRGAIVWAFEPAPASFAAFSENIRINKLDSQITALPVGLSARSALNVLHMCADTTEPGSVCHSLEDSGAPAKAGTFRQTTLALTMDDLVRNWGAPLPHFIKIDVDGIEPLILSGGTEVLSNPALQSVLIEMDAEHDTERNKTISDLLARAGLQPREQGEVENGTRNVIFHRP